MDKLNKWLTLIANLGVLIGIVFVAIEIQQNTQVSRSIAIDSIQNASREQLMAMVLDESLLALEMKARHEEELSLQERARLSYYYEATLRHLENAFLQNEANLLTDDLLESHEVDVRGMTQNHGFAQRYWEGHKSMFSIEFREYVEGLLRSP
ncbi:MAG: hypothetical protein COA96_06940 [SAR86 cluster bacterium]|uniref:Uncharacterized protein n=1 Tax=SAR86 cluster bacterium TaxID=2030880 RepID=A0A2A5B3W2_9GAMM|nr:MAG: hypothetical protein COA96_06940 [SAR86 cluster bacterium]